MSPVVEIYDGSGYFKGEQEIRDIDIPFLCQSDLRAVHAYFELLQRMICTMRSENSRVGVMDSRHPRTGVGMQIESAKDIFGEAIMAGSVETEKTNFRDIEEIKKDFPAVYRFLPALSHLEALFQSPVTLEFATDMTPRQELFSLLQLNPSEMTGRSAFISVMDLFSTTHNPPKTRR
jgi:hypothetical protein